jgi:hypothetical protein
MRFILKVYATNKNRDWQRIEADLSALGVSIRVHPPKSKHLHQLVAYWQSQGHSPKTMANKLAMIRAYVQDKYHKALPSNHLLGVVILQQSLQGFDQEDIPCLYHPITQTLIDFPCLFGLSVSESIHLQLHRANTTHQLIIPRKISHNRQERMIPIISRAQKAAITQRLALCNSTGQLGITAKLLQQWLKSELQWSNLPTTGYRFYYVRQRWQTLATQGDGLKQLAQELGLSLRYARKIIHESQHPAKSP